VVAIDDHREELTYDANGNIQTYKRNGSGNNLNLNNYSYTYQIGTNKLTSLKNSVDNKIAAYGYDAIGNVIKDEKQNVLNNTWNLYGKLQKVEKKDGKIITYSYDAGGNRISKTVGDTTEIYVRDAVGNVLLTYQKNPLINSGHVSTKEFYKYGSNLLGIKKKAVDMQVMAPNTGIQTFVRGEDEYYLYDHRGNVVGSVSDKKIQVDANADGLVDYYTADVRTATLYSSFGAMSKSFNGDSMQFGHNGQRLSPEISTTAQTALFWEFDGDIGRRWNTDPIIKDWESPYATFGGNPIWMTDPDGDDWYKDSKGADKGQVIWKEGSGKHKGYKNVGATYDGYTNEGGKNKWMNGEANGKKYVWQDAVVVTSTRKKDNSLMESMLQVGNVTKASMEEYNSRPKPSYYDPNPLKTIFWKATIGALSPIKDADAYVSATIKQKTDLNTFSSNLNGASTTTVWFGLQGGVTTKDNQGFYGNMVTGDYSYISYKNSATGTEIRALPFKGLGVSLSSNKGPIYGEYSPQLRVLQDTKLRLYGIPIQAEMGMGRAQNPTIGLRGKLETPTFLNYSAEVTGGIRLSLKVPDVISAMFQ